MNKKRLFQFWVLSFCSNFIYAIQEIQSDKMDEM